MLVKSPLEQFEILPFINLNLNFIDLSITNQTFICLLLLFLIVIYYFSLLKNKTNTLFLIPTFYQIIIEILYKLILNMILDNVSGKKNYLYFPLIFVIFFIVAVMNLVGLIPYSFTITSHFLVTLSLSLSIFLGLNILCIRMYKLTFFSLFLPSGTSVALSFLLVPVELISYVFKPLSLAIRLFCNMMAGHTLLKVFAGFSWSLMSLSGFLFLLSFIPLLILIPLFVLELGVALIQAFVFSLLTCIYLNDSLNLH